jgi:O-acetylhomoserine/O-acetylserine sulfhydrylase-like pyridoxal-dependent enzyme
MKQEKINYKEIMSLGFNEKLIKDENYFNQYGFKYAIVTLNLTDKIYLTWDKNTQFCNMERIDNPKTCNIKAIYKVTTLQSVKTLIDFFTGTNFRSREIGTVKDNTTGTVYFDFDEGIIKDYENNK